MSDELGNLIDAFDGERPLAAAATIPGRWYFDPDLFEAECQGVFANTWIVAGRTVQVAEPGQFFTSQVAGEPIVVVRGEDGILRAFSNVCRHRAARVVEAPCGRATRLRCRYHGWTYDLAGRLRGTPEFDGVADFRREDNGLVPLSVGTWSHWVFVHLRRPELPLLEFLDPLPALVEPLGIDKLHYVGEREYVLNCNWKVFVDNFLDGGYHVNTVHPSLASVLDYPNYRTDVYRHASVQLSPMRAPDAGREDVSAAAVRKGTTARYWWLFPNWMLNLYGGVMDTNLVLPLSPTSCRVVFQFYFTEPAGQETDAFIAESIAVADRIQQEDVGICEEVQTGLASRFYDTGRFSVRREAGGYHFHQLLARSLRSR